MNTLDSGDESVARAEATGEDGLEIVIYTTKEAYSRSEEMTIVESFDTTYLCTYRTDGKAALFVVTRVDQGEHSVDKYPGR